MDQLKEKKIILGSQSKIRSLVLEKHLSKFNLSFESMSSNIDESKIKTKNTSFDKIALELAQNKAFSVFQTVKHDSNNTDFFIIGADQLCVMDDVIFNKPMTPEKAVKQLTILNGKEHALISALSLFCNGEEVWSTVDSVEMKMKDLPKSMIESYVSLDNPIHSCGAYYFEKNGHQLFESVSGSEDTILGLNCEELVPKLKQVCS